MVYNRSIREVEKAIVSTDPEVRTALPATEVANAATVSHDPQITLLIPEHDEAAPAFSIVVPALNEELTIADFITWCHEGIKASGLTGEILIIDSSTDRTAEIARTLGARVLKTPRRGLGRAYIDALPFIRGRYVILGDADCTYDFRRLNPFLEKLQEGAELVMGSRFSGSIERGAMPKLHRYFGTPVTTFIFNVIYGTRFSDIHCGMRALSTEALRRIDLHSQSWEYASEMLLKAIHLRLRTVEVPVDFHKDREGRLSHHRRSGWFSPWLAGWINLRVMLVYGVDFFALLPGLAMFAVGVSIMLLLATGPLTLSGFTFSLNTLFLTVVLAIVGLQLFFCAVMARCLYDPDGSQRKRWLKRFPYSRTVLIAFGAFVVGLALVGRFLLVVGKHGYVAGTTLFAINHTGISGLGLVALSFQAFISTLLIHAIAAYRSSKKEIVND